MELENRVCSSDKWKLFGTARNLIFDTDLTFTTDLYRQIFGKNMISILHLACAALFSTLQMQVDLYNIFSITSNLQNQMKCFEWPHLWLSLAYGLRLIFSPTNLKILASKVTKSIKIFTSRLFDNKISIFRKCKIFLQKISVKLIWF